MLRRAVVEKFKNQLDLLSYFCTIHTRIQQKLEGFGCLLAYKISAIVTF